MPRRGLGGAEDCRPRPAEYRCPRMGPADPDTGARTGSRLEYFRDVLGGFERSNGV